ncbi:3-ketoacyl-CoA thiolase, peroxisomal [Fusarium oxysporum f. sp. albedinis]|nr:3-ketoacyl-CoA thiolase, peroxisomal [Fusarium oxysporum f. sp. albedinis]
MSASGKLGLKWGSATVMPNDGSCLLVWTEPVRSIIQLEVSDKLSALVVGRYPCNISVEMRENNVVVRKSDWPSFTW